MHVLIIDDELFEMLVAVLKTAGIEAIGFAEGSSAIEWLKRNKTDLIVIDLALRHLSGMRVAERIRELGIKTKIIFITGKDLEKIDYEWAEELESRIYQKPFDASKFIEMVSGTLDVHETR